MGVLSVISLLITLFIKAPKAVEQEEESHAEPVLAKANGYRFSPSPKGRGYRSSWAESILILDQCWQKRRSQLLRLSLYF